MRLPLDLVNGKSTMVSLSLRLPLTFSVCIEYKLEIAGYRVTSNWYGDDCARVIYTVPIYIVPKSKLNEIYPHGLNNTVQNNAFNGISAAIKLDDYYLEIVIIRGFYGSVRSVD